MGTHSYIIMRVKHGETWVVYCKLYQQYDGYPEGVGMDLLNFLVVKKLVNGFGDDPNQANGAGCLFAQIVAKFKNGVGGAYITNPNDNDLEYFNYYVDVDEDNRTIRFSINDVFSGTCQEAIDHIKSKSDF